MKCLLNSTENINTTENQQALFFYFMGEKISDVYALYKFFYY